MARLTDFTVTLAGGRRAETTIRGHRVLTDQPLDNGGDDAAPTPYELLLASVGTCVAVTLQGFAAKRGLPVEGLTVKQSKEERRRRRRGVSKRETGTGPREHLSDFNDLASRWRGAGRWRRPPRRPPSSSLKSARRREGRHPGVADGSPCASRSFGRAGAVQLGVRAGSARSSPLVARGAMAAGRGRLDRSTRPEHVQ